MVKKVQGKKSNRTTGTAPVQATKTVESSKVGQVDQVKSSDQTRSVGKAGDAGTEITPELREKLFKLIEEEADRLFGDDSESSERRKQTVKGAVKMAIQSGMLSEEEER